MRLRRQGVNIALGLASIVMALAAIEVVLRLWFPIPYSVEIQYVDDGHVGWRLEPNRTYKLLFEGGTCHINNLGFRRATDTPYVKPPGTKRVFLMGGSAAFSHEVPDGRTWVDILEQELKRRYGDHVELINASVPGYDVFVSKVNYLAKLRRLNPDIVLVSHTWNDIKLMHHFEGEGFYLKPIAPSRNRLWRELRKLQVSWRLLAAYEAVFGPLKRENVYTRDDRPPADIRPGGPAQVWVRKNYDDLALLLKSDGVLPVFMSQPGLLSPDNVDDPAVRAKVKNEYAFLSIEETLEQWQAMSAIIAASAIANDVPFIDVAARVPHRSDLFLDHVHLSVEGEELVGRLAFEALVQDPRVDAALRAP